MIFGIHGKKRSGKDTAAKFIAEYDNSITVCSLATPIKRALEFASMKTRAGFSYADIDGKGKDRDVVEFKLTRQFWLEAIKYLNDTYIKFSNDQFDVLNNIIIGLNVERPITMRRMMQLLGTDIIVDHVDRDYWIKCIESEVRVWGLDVVIPDIRQEHEIEYARKHGLMFFVYRDTKMCDNHITERGLTPLEHEPIIHNDSTLDSFRYDVLNTYKELKCKNKFNNCKHN